MKSLRTLRASWPAGQPVLPAPGAGTLARVAEPPARPLARRKAREKTLLNLIKSPRTLRAPPGTAAARQRTLAPRLRAAQVQVGAGER